MMNERYIVDERSGMAAIVDTFYPREGYCLEGPGVYSTISLPRGSEHVHERRELLAKIQIKCDNLNAKNTISSKEAYTIYNEYYRLKQEMNRVFGEANCRF